MAYLGQWLKEFSVGTSLAVHWLRLCFHYRENGFDPWVGEIRSYFLHGMAKIHLKIRLVWKPMVWIQI